MRGQKGSKMREQKRADQGTLLMASEYSCHPFNSNNNDNEVSLVFIPSCQIHARDRLTSPLLLLLLSSPFSKSTATKSISINQIWQGILCNIIITLHFHSTHMRQNPVLWVNVAAASPPYFSFHFLHKFYTYSTSILFWHFL